MRREDPGGDESDEALVAAALAGDDRAGPRLFARWQPLLRAEVRQTLRGVMRRRVGDSDVVQEAWIAVFGRLAQFVDRGPGSFGRWIRRIVRHKASDAVRRHVGTAKRGGAVEVTRRSASDERAVADPRARTPGSEAVRREESARLHRGMAALTADQRFVLECVHRKGMTFVEIGGSLGRSANAVCQMYGRGVRSLARAMGEVRGT